jgi:hypothetical protein
MKAILKSEDLLPYLNNPDSENSTYPKPDPEDPKLTQKSIQKNDDAIVTAIFLATAEEFRKFIDLDSKAYQAWKNLEDYFLSQSSNNVNRLEEELQAIVIDGCNNMADYTNQKLEKCLELAAAKEERANSDQYKVKAIMAGLRGHPQYGHCAVMFEDVHHSLHKFLGQLNDTYASMPNTRNEGAFFARPNILCYRCSKPGHVQRNCPQSNGQQNMTRTSSPTCNWCRKPGHKIQDCRAFKNTGQVLWQKQEDTPQHESYTAYEHALTTFSSSPKTTLTTNVHRLNYTPDILSNTTYAQKAETQGPSSNHWWTVDSGASSHMTNQLEDFSDFTLLPNPIDIHTADTQTNLRATAIGTVHLGPNLPKLTNTLFVPGLAHKLLSLSKTLDKGYRTEFSKSHFHILDPSGNSILSGPRKGDLYYIEQTNTAPTSPQANICQSETQAPRPIPTQIVSRTLQEWHETLGHISREAIIRTSKAVTGMVITDKESKLSFCDFCALSKAHKIPFPKQDPNSQPDQIGDILVGDYQGPFAQRSLGGANGISSFTDKASGYVFSKAVKVKTSTFDHFVTINEQFRTKHGRSIKILRTDNGGEYKNTLFEKYCQENGIIHQFTNPHTPEQNKCAEKHNQILFEKLLTMLNSSHISKALWAEVYQATVHIHNRTVRSNNTLTPYELWTGEKPNLSNLHPIGTTTFVLIPKCNQRKLVTDKAVKGHLVGFGEELGTKGYCILTDQKTILSSRHVTFHRQDQVHSTHLPDTQQPLPMPLESMDDDNDSMISPDTCDIITPPQIPTAQEQQNITPDIITPSTESLPQDSRLLKELESQLGPAFQPINTTRRSNANIAHALMTTNTFINTPEPLTYNEAMSGPEASQWQQSVDNEFQSWIDNEVAVIVDEAEIPPDAKLIHGRPVFKRKINELGEIVRYKCRGVAKGYTQRPGIDFQDRESPVIRQPSLRTLLSIAASQDLETNHGDVDTAFLIHTQGSHISQTH